MKKYLLLVLITMTIVSCGEPTINGKVVDNFEKPVSDFDVAIKGTSLKTKTNSNGEYSIEFVPGNDIKINFTKENYLSSEITVNIATKDDYPAETINTYKVPKSEGIFLVGEKDYIEIPKVNVKSERLSYSKSVRVILSMTAYNGPTTFKGYNYFAELQEKDLPVFKSGTIKFADTSPLPISLIKLEKAGDKFKISSISYPTEAYHPQYGYHYEWDSKSRMFKKYKRITNNKIKTDYKSFKERNNGKSFGIRTNELTKGYYAFCVVSKNPTKAIETEYVLAFKIE